VNGIDVWCTDLDAAPPRDPASILSADERERAARFRFDVHRNRFLRCRALLRQRLAETLDLDAASIVFQYGAHGKPEVDGVHFNVSHSDHFAVIAISRDMPVGIDVERIDGSKEVLPLARTAFSIAEYEALAAMTPSEQLASFFRTWARKEAYLKLLGTGFSRPSDSFTVSMTNEPLSFVEGCALRDLHVHADFACAIATARETPIALRP
jgi:4'-phosphopantetheinyl transferase